MLFRSTKFGDDVDRALKKEDGSWTYFASDIAYHFDKISRGFNNMIVELGSDHGGYVKRLKAFVSALSDDQAKIEVKLHNIVNFFENGKPVKMSKRSGNFLTARDVVEEVVLYPSLFLIFIDDLLGRTANPIYSFADDSNLCHSYSFDHMPSLQEIEDKRHLMDETLGQDLLAISEWGRMNRVYFNARKTQCCLLSHKRFTGPSTSSISIDGTDVEQSDALDVLGMRIQCDARWAKHVFEVSKEAFKCLGFLKRCKKYFTPSDLLNIYTTYVRPKMEYNSNIWAGAPKSSLELLDRVQRRAMVMIGDSRVSSSIISLEHRRNVGCVTLFYRYFHGVCSSDIRRLIPDVRMFGRDTRLSRNSHPFVIDWPASRTTHYGKNSFFARSVRMWNELPANVFPPNCDVQKFKTNVNKHYSLFPPTNSLFSFRQRNALHV